jgi:hypothetical protein
MPAVGELVRWRTVLPCGSRAHPWRTLVAMARRLGSATGSATASNFWVFGTVR